MLFDFVVVVPVADVDALHKVDFEPFPKIPWIFSLDRKRLSQMYSGNEPIGKHTRKERMGFVGRAKITGVRDHLA